MAETEAKTAAGGGALAVNPKMEVFSVSLSQAVLSAPATPADPDRDIQMDEWDGLSLGQIHKGDSGMKKSYPKICRNCVFFAGELTFSAFHCVKVLKGSAPVEDVICRFKRIRPFPVRVEPEEVEVRIAGLLPVLAGPEGRGPVEEN